MTKPDTWYVAFGPDNTEIGARRSTQTFKSEVDAKVFTTQILAKGWIATAGTLADEQPKRVVEVSEIARWADDPAFSE